MWTQLLQESLSVPEPSHAQQKLMELSDYQAVLDRICAAGGTEVGLLVSVVTSSREMMITMTVLRIYRICRMRLAC